MRKTELAPWVAETISELPPIATVAEVSAVLRQSEGSIRRLVKLGQLRAIRARQTGSARTLITRDAVAVYLTTLESGAAGAPLRRVRAL